MPFDKRREYLRLIAATLGLPLLCAGAVFVLWRWRAALEPAVKLLDWLVVSRRHAVYAYDPDRYWLYGAILAASGLALSGLGLWALWDKPVSDRRLAAYLDRKVADQDREHRRPL